MSGNTAKPATSDREGGNQPLASRRTLLGAVAALPVDTSLRAASAGPDAAFIRLCADHRAMLQAFNAAGVDSDESPIWPHLLRALGFIDEARPQTLAGLRAKALSAVVEATCPDGRTAPAGPRARIGHGIWSRTSFG